MKVAAVRAVLPPELKIEPISDQSVFVRSAISGVCAKQSLPAH